MVAPEVVREHGNFFGLIRKMVVFGPFELTEHVEDTVRYALYHESKLLGPR